MDKPQSKANVIVISSKVATEALTLISEYLSKGAIKKSYDKDALLEIKEALSDADVIKIESWD